MPVDTDGLLNPNVQREEMKRDHELFRLSSLVDVLRDNAKDLLEMYASGVSGSPKLADDMAGRYTKLRTAVSGILPSEDSAFVNEWTVPLESGAAVDEIFDAAASLARAVDSLLNTPGFVAGRVATRNEINKVLKAAGVHPESMVPPTPETRPGQYL